MLKILCGMFEGSFSGTLTVDTPNYKLIRNQSSYIMHDRMLHPLLTVREAINFAFKFKMSPTTTKVQQKCKCDAILNQLDLLNFGDTLTKHLSGGERKRLSIAVELVSDPSILFLDEPTTGLDSSAAYKIVTFLSELAKSGKSVICSIHAPSALMLRRFDHVYAIAEGRCIYQGANGNVVPFLAELNMSCPESFNPADYLIEIATNQYGERNQTLTEKIGNGLIEDYRNEMEMDSRDDCIMRTKTRKYNSTFSYQLLVLIQRNFLLMKRDKNYLFIRFIVAIAMGLITGASFYDVGPFANNIMDTYKFVMSSTQYLLFASFYSLALRFPMDLPILGSEHFNRWYSSLSYYLALIVVDLPVLVGLTLVFVLISCYLSGQPMEVHRLLLILMIGILLSLDAQAFGLLSGSIFSNLTISLVIGSSIVAFHTVFSGVLLLKKDVQPWLKWIFDIVFLNHANHGITVALFGYDREKLPCDYIYCPYRDPEEFLKFLDAPATISFHPFFIIFIIVHVCTYINMKLKLKRLN
ncbi:hypothetical protein HA402_002077 [Bradysia odoriphaga]|nr:hypothetical protein HA402_002077 [Bradysia odoriphaga]